MQKQLAGYLEVAGQPICELLSILCDLIVEINGCGVLQECALLLNC